jgi:hypothetical protein
MKHALLIPLMGVASMMLSSCGNISSPFNSSRTFDAGSDPLDSPGRKKTRTVEAEPKFAPGSFVEVTDANAGLYRRVPRGNEQPEQRLATGTQLKVVDEKGSYVRVETESGQIGFVPAIMVGNRGASTLPLISPEPSGRDLPPPAIEPIDPSGLTPLPPVPTPGATEELPPFVAPEPEVPPISVEEAPGSSPIAPIVPQDPVENE